MHQYNYQLSCGGSFSTDDPKIAQLMMADDRDRARKKKDWLAEIQKIPGVRAAHPDDGWVDRENNSIEFCYPYFAAADLKEGDLIVLGSDPWRTDAVNHRIVRIVSKEELSFFLGNPHGAMRYRWFFEEVK